MPTRRERALDLLQRRQEGWTPDELAEALELDKGTVLEDLRHLRASLKRSGLALEIAPAHCRACGWTADPERARDPRRCAACRGTHLDRPRFRVVLRA